ncbi:hypothetical protein FOA52_012286 [Chlamydomonas sp. UWO 241]|nr:hypothetical protein FOA52_012286 [Chlamydomonas sp. UWO 241]
MDDTNLYDTSECTHGNVIGIMRPGATVLTCSPGESLQAIIPRLDKVTGLPVISPEGRCIGVISRKDIIKIRKGRVQGTMADTVSMHMTSPAIVIEQNSPVRVAADLMLANNIRRLPVVDDQGLPVGIVSKSDIFKPLFQEAYNLYMQKETAALSGQVTMTVVNTTDGKAVSWKVKYLYDGDCPMCASLMNVLKRQDNGRELIRFVNIADPEYDATSHMGIAYANAMETIHAIKPDGTVIRGTDALMELFDAVGLGWATRIAEMPIVSKLVDLLYNFLSANRLSLGGAMDGIIAAKRMEMSKQGVETCQDVDEQCEAEW